MNMEEATIVKWHKGVGESFVEGDAIYEVETDKVTQVVEATGGGKLVEILVPEVDPKPETVPTLILLAAASEDI